MQSQLQMTKIKIRGFRGTKGRVYSIRHAPQETCVALDNFSFSTLGWRSPAALSRVHHCSEAAESYQLATQHSRAVVKTPVEGWSCLLEPLEQEHGHSSLRVDICSERPQRVNGKYDCNMWGICSSLSCDEPVLASIMIHDHAKDVCASALGPLMT